MKNAFNIHRLMQRQSAPPAPDTGGAVNDNSLRNTFQAIMISPYQRNGIAGMLQALFGDHCVDERHHHDNVDCLGDDADNDDAECPALVFVLAPV